MEEILQEGVYSSKQIGFEERLEVEGEQERERLQKGVLIKKKKKKGPFLG